ncbi:hypothetical protein [Kribbella shirazensis]|uniref:Uncharacterized protein n=1 Tax=Kribbella shirazensis TaxID=1105143 RepID=A0A7X5VCQ2_9ACTN|nr:hypothetical protein [Kribbella shirazensis]NIK58574.1 hypothetical protein [Kribbella shirazensis]
MAEGNAGPRARRHRGRPNRSGGWLGLVVLAVTGTLTLALVGVLAWAALFNDRDTSVADVAPGRTTSQSPHADHTSAPAASQPSASPLLARTASLEGCVAEVAAADAEVAAARIGIGHWAEHIQARTDLLTGSQPKEVTKAIWKRTREAGPADLTRHQQAVAEHARRAGSCAGAPKSTQLTACQQRLRILDKAVATGAAGMGDWRAHQNAMAAHKAGEIDAAHAQTMWEAAWTAAPKNINAFKAADATLRTAPACRS